MSDTRLNIPRLVELCGAMCDGVIDDAGMAELDSMLVGSAEARRIYGLVVDTHLDLESGASVEPAAPIVIGRIEPASSKDHWGAVAIAAGVALAAAIVAIVAMATAPTGTTVAPARPVAVVVDAVGVAWSTEPAEIGDELTPGTIRISRGRIDLTMHSGATVSAVGPVELTLRSNDRCDLSSGQLTAKVPERAIGFTVGTPRFTVVDLGTEFGVRVRGDGAGEVRVFTGRVVVDDGDRTVVEGGHGRRYAASGEATDFPVASRWRDEPMRVVHYSFDETTGDPFVDTGFGFEDGPFDIDVDLRRATPRRIEGVFGGAVEMTPGDVMDTGFPGIADGSERTVAFWLRLPVDARPGESQAVISWGDHRVTGGAWQVGWDYWREQSVGSLRLFVGESGVIAGTRDLRDGAWHHVAVVLGASDAPDVSRDVRLYIDGELETVARNTAAAIDTRAGSDVSPVRIGWGLREGRGAFRGAIDELYIVDHALNADEIARLMKSNEWTSVTGE